MIQSWSPVHNTRLRAWNRPGSVGERSRASGRRRLSRSSGYVGYALKEPWGQPRAVIGFSADEAERLAEFLERDGIDPDRPWVSSSRSGMFLISR